MPSRSSVMFALLAVVIVIASGRPNAQRAPSWTINETGKFEAKTYPAGTTTDFAFARREANAMGARWMPNAKLCKIDFRAAPPMLAPGAGDRGMFEAYFYYFVPDADQSSWKGLLVSVGMPHGQQSPTVTSSKFTSNPPTPTAAPTSSVDPVDALRRLNLPLEEVLKSGIHLKAAGSPFTTAINFGLSNGEFERYIDRTLPAGQWVWWTELHPGTGKNSYVYIDLSTGRGTVVSQLR